MASSAEAFQNQRWSVKQQPAVFRHHQALLWLDNSSAPVMDVGCGDGFLLNELRHRGIEAFGIDVSSEAVFQCHEKGIKAYVVDFETSSLDAYHAKTAVLLDVLEHLFQPHLVLRELTSCVSSLMISVPNFASLPARVQVLLGRVPENNLPRMGHVFWFTRKTLHQLLEQNGWNVVEWSYNTFWEDKPLIGNVMRSLVRFWPSLFALSFLVRAEPRRS